MGRETNTTTSLGRITVYNAYKDAFHPLSYIRLPVVATGSLLGTGLLCNAKVAYLLLVAQMLPQSRYFTRQH
jgi:hypothetical protein